MNNDAQDSDGVDIGKKHKLGHLRVDTQGNTTFKHLPTNQLVEALQLGIQHSVAGLEAKEAHPILVQDFATVQIINFPKSGRSGLNPTPPHRFNEFIIRSYAPKAFRHFRERFDIRPEDYLAMINKPFREVKNPGASGSLFYLTADDEFIIKTVEKKEAEFLKSLLPGYYMNIIQNPRTLLPKFFGLYCYQGENRNIRIMLMNNLIPSHVHIHEKYDLKGSTYKRRANDAERQKEKPTWKDLDFMERHPDGFILEYDTFVALKRTVEQDCRVLESFHIMDYSFLMGAHYLERTSDSPREESPTPINNSSNPFSIQPKRMAYSTPMDTIQAEFDQTNTPDDDLAKTGGIPARTARGDRMLLYVGIIDILQSYQIKKKLEHGFKSLMTDGTQISVTNPKFYSERFQKFLFKIVFKQAPQRASRLLPNDLASVVSLSPWIERGIGPPYAYPNNLNPIRSSPSTTTVSSRSTSNYASNESSRQSTTRTKHGSSTTLYGSSRQSDSLYNEPVHEHFPRIVTSSFNKNDKHSVKLQSDKDLSSKKLNKRRNLTDIDRKHAYSSTNLSSNSRQLSNYLPKEREENHQSIEEVTRL